MRQVSSKKRVYKTLALLLVFTLAVSTMALLPSYTQAAPGIELGRLIQFGQFDDGLGHYDVQWQIVEINGSVVTLVTDRPLMWRHNFAWHGGNGPTAYPGPFFDNAGGNDWTTSSLRYALNSTATNAIPNRDHDFLNGFLSGFTAGQIAAIQPFSLETGTDLVVVPSRAEVLAWWPDNTTRGTHASSTSGHRGYQPVIWWTRDAGTAPGSVQAVDGISGFFQDQLGIAANFTPRQIDARPTIRLDLSLLTDGVDFFTSPTPTFRPWVATATPVGASVDPKLVDEVSVSFNLRMNKTLAGTVTLLGGSSPITLTGGTWDAIGRTITFTLPVELEFDIDYIIRVSGFSCFNGAPINPNPDNSSSFTTIPYFAADLVNFGNYQDAPLLWEIVDDTDDVLTLVLFDLLDNRAFRTQYTAADANQWIASEIRTYLNNNFLSDAFTATQQTLIMVYSDETGPDRIVIPSAAENNTWWCFQTQRTHPINDINNWWLRDAGIHMNMTTMFVIREFGRAITTGNVTNLELGVRPVIRVEAPILHTVYFYDGDVQIASRIVIDGQPVIAPADPTRTGYNFIGWEIEEGTLWDILSPVTGSMTLNAVWMQESTLPIFSWNIFNNGLGGTQYPRPNASLAEAGLIRMWAQLDGVGAPVYLTVAETIAALDQDNNCAMEFVRVNRVWVAGQGWADYFTSVDINKNGNWKYINFYITAYGQNVHALLVNANYRTDYYTVTFVVEAGAIGVYATTTTTTKVAAGKSIPAGVIPSTVARTGFYFAGWYPSNPAGFIVRDNMTFTAVFTEIIQAEPKIISITPNPAIVQRGNTVELTVTTQGMPDGAWIELNVAWRGGLSIVGGPRFTIVDNQAAITVAATPNARQGRDGFAVSARVADDWGISFIIDSYAFVIEVQ